VIRRRLQQMMVNSSRVHLAKHNAEFAAMVPDGALVLDAGAGDAPYRELFRHARYESADFEKVNKQYATSTYVCDLVSIPVEDERFDFVLLNQVLEHLPEPKQVLRELNRVLKPGGKLFCTAPLFYEEHEKPYDFYRYTQFAYRYLLGESGFTIDRIDWMEGYLGTVAYQLHTASRYLPASPRALHAGTLGYVASPLIVLLRVVFASAALLFSRLDIRAPYKKAGFPKNYVVLATKAVASA
jgi:ubiquinone/menaquinone biosynthesis C-methylase UbiE